MKLSREQAWERIVASHIDLSQPVNSLNASVFKELGQEPRLMTKFDARAARPKVLSENGLFLLPKTNGSYFVIKSEGYCDLKFPPPAHLEKVEARFPVVFDSLRGAQSEMSHLDRLFLAGIIARVVGVNDPTKVWATIRGRRFAPKFSYELGDLGLFDADRVQYEVDQGYETDKEIILFEAKSTTPSDFLIRQLFFPYRIFSSISKKKIRPFFFNCNAITGVYSFFEYRFNTGNRYDSIQLENEQHFRIQFVDEKKPETLGDWLKHVPAYASLESWEVPQADDISKVIDFPFHVARGCTDAGLMAGAFDFDPRQSSYYRRASEQMGLVNNYELTEDGRNFLTLSSKEREEYLIKALLLQPVVRTAIETALKRPDHRVLRQDIVESIAKNSHLSKTTPGRRASTVLCWLRWLQTTLGELRVGNAVLRFA